MSSLKALRSLLAEAIGQDEDLTDKGVAHRILTSLGVRGHALEVLLPLVELEVAGVRRGGVRQLEHAAARRQLGRSPIDVVAARAKLLDSAFPLGDGRWVTWGDATIADHEDRIVFLARQRDGVIATIGRHEDAISVIKEASVSCLREIEEAA